MKDEYLGDGVYVSFDGDQIWLAINHHDNKVVALEPAVWDALKSYIQRLEREIQAKPLAKDLLGGGGSSWMDEIGCTRLV